MALINEIKKNKDLRKIFGKRELKIIEKQLMGVRLSPSEKTRLSRDIRKKFGAIKSLMPNQDEFELKKGKNVKDIISETIDIIKKHQWFWKINEIILFGSLTSNKFHLFSDIDIAVKFKDIAKKEALIFRKEILGQTNKKADIQIYNFLPNKIKKEIDKNGKILFKK